jgi:hypothetical protein
MRVSVWLLIALLISIRIQAATFCIAAGDVGGLNAALAAAANNTESDTIQLQAGRYDFFAPIEHYATEPYDLSIEGGYQDFFGNPCGLAPQVEDATQTVLDGNSLASILLDPDGGSLTVRNLTIQNAEDSDLDPAVEIQSAFNILVENSIFQGNLAYNHAGVSIGGGHAVQIQDSLFASNVSLDPTGFAVQITNTDSVDAICNVIVNSTFSANFSQSAGLVVWNWNQGNCLTLVGNTILWGNGGPTDLTWNNNTPMYLINDDIGNYNLVPVVATDTISIDPLFKNQADGDYSLQDASLVHNKGNAGSIFWGPGQWDVLGNPRVDGAYPDIGAYELQDVIFASSLDQEPPP